MNQTQENELGKTFVQSLDAVHMQPLEKSLRQELNEVAATIRQRQSDEIDRIMHDQQLGKYSVNGNEDVWKEELKNVSDPGVISIPRFVRSFEIHQSFDSHWFFRTLNKRKDVEIESHFDLPKKKNKNKNKKK